MINVHNRMTGITVYFRWARARARDTVRARARRQMDGCGVLHTLIRSARTFN